MVQFTMSGEVEKRTNFGRMRLKMGNHWNMLVRIGIYLFRTKIDVWMHCRCKLGLITAVWSAHGMYIVLPWYGIPLKVGLPK